MLSNGVYISERGWVTIDTDIFFWNYETGGDLAYYEGLAEVVLSVGLVAPKPGVFQPHIKFLLVSGSHLSVHHDLIK